MANNKNALRWWPTWCLVGLLAIVGRVSARYRVLTGQALGHLLLLTMRRRRAIAAANLRFCFPDESDQWRKEILREHFSELGIAVIDTAAAWVQAPEALSSLTHFKGQQHLQKALDKGRGVIVVAAHMTALEMSMQLASMQQPGAAIYRRNKNPVIESVSVAGRTRLGSSLIDRQDMRSVLLALRRNEVVWISPDQDHGISHGAFIDFFGNEAATVTTPARLAMRTGAQVLVLLYRRLPGEAGYELEFSPALQNFPGDDVNQATRRLNQMIEQQVYLAPAQYLWVHRRFKTRPQGQRALYE